MTAPPQRLAAALADRYTIEQELGQGGMATVYLAHDLKHDRKVAVKVLRPELAAVIGAERFLAEIKTTANLQHPHILPLFDSGVADSFLFYAMPFIEGESLRDKLTREKQLPINDAVRIASEIASALDYAHRHGVIHRDIKPENILLHDGSALVADFGIALAASKAGTRMTETGMSLGTPQYMSPEQAMGERELDARSDIYALGCVTYEMLTGEPPFSGPTAQAIVAKVMTAEPVPIRQLRSTVSAAVDAATITALQKLPADRFRTAAEFAAALVSESPVSRSVSITANSPRARAFSIAALFAAGMGVGAAIAGIAAHRTFTPMVFGRATHVTWDRGLEITPALSPDGRTVAYAEGSLQNLHIMVRGIAGGRALRLTGDTTTPEANPRWSHDGSRIYFLSRNGVFSAPAGGGPATPEIPGTAAAPVAAVAPAPDGPRLAFTRGDSLLVRMPDGTARGLARMAEPTLCDWSPNGAMIACASGTALYSAAGSSFGNLSPGPVMICRVKDGALFAATDSVSLNTSPAWSPDGRWLYFVSDRDGQHDIYGVRIDGDGRAHGTSVRLSVGLGAHTISLAANGSDFAYSLYSARAAIWSIPIAAHPPETSAAATRLTGTDEYIENFSVSPDEKWLYYDSDLSGNEDIFRVAIAGGEPEQLTTNPADDFAPDVAPDGKSFAFHSWRSGNRDIYVQHLDGSGVEQITHTPLQEALAAWSPDGSALGFSELTAQGGIWIARRDTAGHWGAPVRRYPSGSTVAWSPDGRSIAFVGGVNGGNLEVAASDSGAARTIINYAARGLPLIVSARWAPNPLLYFATYDDQGHATIWSATPGGANITPQLRLDPVLHPSYRATFDVSRTKFYFIADDRQSDIWVMQVVHP